MPLDDSGYGSSDYQAMLILPTDVSEHIGHSRCMKGLWISAAQGLFCNKLEISPAHLYVTTADEVKTGHLISHKGKICVFGAYPDPHGEEKPSHDHLSTVEGCGVYTSSNTYLEFPETTQRLIEEGYDFDAVITIGSYALCLCEVDLKKSKSSNSITLNRPANMYQFSLPPIVILGW